MKFVKYWFELDGN